MRPHGKTRRHAKTAGASREQGQAAGRQADRLQTNGRKRTVGSPGSETRCSSSRAGGEPRRADGTGSRPHRGSHRVDRNRGDSSTPVSTDRIGARAELQRGGDHRRGPRRHAGAWQPTDGTPPTSSAPGRTAGATATQRAEGKPRPEAAGPVARRDLQVWGRRTAGERHQRSSAAAAQRRPRSGGRVRRVTAAARWFAR